MLTPVSLDPLRGSVRGLRAGVLTAPAVLSGLMAHASAGECTTALGVLLSVVVLWPAAVALLRRRTSPLAMMGWVFGAQAATHVLLEWTCPEVSSGRIPMWQHVTAGVTPGMLALHLAAGGLAAFTLHRADGALWTAHGLLRCFSRATRWAALLPTSAPAPVEGVRTYPVFEAVVVLEDEWKAPPPVRRGLPAQLRPRSLAA